LKKEEGTNASIEKKMGCGQPAWGKKAGGTAYRVAEKEKGTRTPWKRDLTIKGNEKHTVHSGLTKGEKKRGRPTKDDKTKKKKKIPLEGKKRAKAARRVDSGRKGRSSWTSVQKQEGVHPPKEGEKWGSVSTKACSPDRTALRQDWRKKKKLVSKRKENWRSAKNSDIGDQKKRPSKRRGGGGGVLLPLKKRFGIRGKREGIQRGPRKAEGGAKEKRNKPFGEKDG